MKTCDLCKGEEITFTSGYHYGAKCCRKYLDRVDIHNILSNAFPTLTLTNIENLCREMFGGDDYGYATFSKLYDILDRGAWNDTEKRFEVPTSIYLVWAFDRHIQLKHPKLAERIKDDKRIPRYW